MKNKIILKIVLATLFICLTIFLVFILSKSMKTEESENVKEDIIKELEIYKQGKIYLQSLSSMLPPLVLNPKPQENILDMAAAPRRKNNRDGSFVWK